MVTARCYCNGYNRAVKHRRGFTLVETLVGLLILTFVVTTSLTIILERERRLQFAAETIAAYQVLANEVEVRRHVPFELLESGQTDKFVSDLELIRDLPGVVRLVTIRETSPGIKRITLALRWRGGRRAAEISMIRTFTGGDNLW